MIIGGNTNEIYRLDLEQGCFVNPFKTNCSGINKIGISDVHQLYAFGSENGILECWDPRTRHNVSSLQACLSGERSLFRCLTRTSATCAIVLMA